MRKQFNRVCCSLLLALFLLPVSSTAKVIAPDTPLSEPVSSGLGGRTLVVEEITATWCPSCAEIDPELAGVADGHGSRIALLALHPSDGEDAFQPAASQHRIDRLLLTKNVDAFSTPTFVVEGGVPRVGYDAWTDVQRDILDTELRRQSTSELEFVVQQTSERLEASIQQANLKAEQNDQLTFLVLQHHKPMPDGFAHPGGPHRDRVVVGIAECHLATGNITFASNVTAKVGLDGCASSFAIEFDEPDAWSVVLIHETATDALQAGQPVETFGAVELAKRERSSDDTTQSVAPWVIGGLSILSLMAIARKK